MLPEITQQLHRHPAAACPVCRPLQLPLELHAGQQIAAAEIFRTHGHNHGAVGVTAVSGLVTHAVDRKAALLRGSVDHVPARAHAKRIDAPAAADFTGHLVGSCGQSLRIPLAILAHIDHFLEMLNPHANRKGFPLHGDGPAFQHGKGIPGAVADGQHQHLRLQIIRFLFRFAAALCIHAADLTVPDVDVRELCTEAHLSTEVFNLFSDMLHHANQHICAQVRLIPVENLLRRAGLYKGLKDQTTPARRILHQRIQLAVGKCARTTLAELHIGIRYERAAVPEVIHSLFPLSGGLAPLQQDRPITCPGQHQATEQARRAGSHDNRAVFQHLISGLRKMVPLFLCL